MKEWQVWSEGYVANGNRGKAIYHGKFYGETFRDSVLAFKDSLSEDEAKNINTEEGQLDIWGCNFFDNENDAVALFG